MKKSQDNQERALQLAGEVLNVFFHYRNNSENPLHPRIPSREDHLYDIMVALNNHLQEHFPQSIPKPYPPLKPDAQYRKYLELKKKYDPEPIETTETPLFRKNMSDRRMRTYR